MGETILKGHRVCGGKAQGEALVSHEAISFFGGVDPETGIILEKGHELEGINLCGKILVFPTGKGSSVGSYRLYEMVLNGTQPSGIINLRADPVVAVGAIFSRIPMVDRCDRDPLALIKTGDFLEVDADEGVVKINPAQSLEKQDRESEDNR
jgi:predicted aconitase with swiveling domain